MIKIYHRDDGDWVIDDGKVKAASFTLIKAIWLYIKTRY